MASFSSKKRKEEISEESESDLSSSEEDDDDGENSESDVDPQMEIQVEFEARNPAASDFNGIKRLLQQLLLKTHINLSEITDIILEQSKVGSVLKCVVDEVDQDDDDDDDDNDETYGISTIINLNHHKDVSGIQHFTEFITKKCENEELLNILKNKKYTIGWLISERFINIPPHIAPPLYASLRSEVTKACSKGKPYNFDYILYLCKSYKMNMPSKKKKKKNTQKTTEDQTNEIMFINAEDEILYQKAMLKFDFDVSDEGDVLVAGKWSESDDQMSPYRTVMLIPWSEMDTITTEIENFVM